MEIEIWSNNYLTKETFAHKTLPYLIKIFAANPLEQKGKMLFYLIQINTLRRFSHSSREETRLQDRTITQFDFSLTNFDNLIVCPNKS